MPPMRPLLARLLPVTPIALTLLCLGVRPLGAEELRPNLPDALAGAYTLAWHDEFDGAALNLKEWQIRTGTRYASKNLAANVRVEGGCLKLDVKKEAAGDSEYTSGGVISKREFKYGYYEARFRVPKGAGWHTSFWMMKNSSGQTGNRQEIDVCEQDSKDLKSYGMNLHTHFPEHKQRFKKRVPTPDLAEGFHVWGCEFSPKEVRGYFDGKLVGVVPMEGFEHDVMSIWLTVVGWAKLPWAPQLKIDDALLPASADFDYVRFYERKTESRAAEVAVPSRR